MKILFLSQRFLLPMDTGGKIRTGKILEQLSKDHEITLISNFDQKKDNQYKNEINNLCSKFIPVPWKEICKYSPLFFIRLFFQMFSPYPVSTQNDYSSSLRKTLEREHNNNRYDIAICDFVQSALMFKNILGTPILLFQHNVESIIAMRHVDRAKNPFSKLFWWLQWKKMFLYEKEMCRAFNTVIAVSDVDKKLFEKLYGTANTVTIPTGVDIDYYAPQSKEKEKPNSLVFCGSMDWLPNEDAINFFIDDILPLVKKKIPSISLTVVGRNPSPQMKKKVQKHPEINLTGWVEDTRPYIAKSSLFIVPIRIGGGTRMKIFEAMAMGKPTISTSIGAEGLPLVKDEHIILSDTSTQFAQAVIDLLRDTTARGLLGKKSGTYVRESFTWHKVAGKFSALCLSSITSFQERENA